MPPASIRRDVDGLRGYGGGGVPGGVSALSQPSCCRQRSFILSDAINLRDASADDKPNNDSGLDLVR